jgi:hypothetical protein
MHLEAQASTTPGASPGVSFFVVQERRETEARQGFRAAGLHGVTAVAKAGRFMTPTAGIKCLLHPVKARNL